MTGAIIFIHLFSGDLYKAFQYTKQLKELTKELYNPFFTGWASYFSGVIHFFWGNYQAAISNFQDVIKNQFFWAQDPNTDAFTGLLLSYQALGMEEKAQETSEQLSIYISKYGKAPYDNVSRSARVRLAILQGDLEQALYLQQVVDFAKDQGVMVYWIEYPRITKCRLLITKSSKEDLQEAVRLLNKHLNTARQFHNTQQQIIILPLLSLAHLRLTQYEKALAVLQEAVALAAPGGWVEPFAEAGKELIPLLMALKEENVSPDFINVLINAITEAHFQMPQLEILQLIDPLTEREVEVIELLAEKYHNAEIATKLAISPATVRRHTSNIYHKLGVNTRKQAVQKAVALGILPVQS